MKSNYFSRSFLALGVFACFIFFSCLPQGPSNREKVLQEYSQLLFTTQDPDEFIQVLLRMDQSYPNDFYLQFRLAERYFIVEQEEEAEKYLKKAEILYKKENKSNKALYENEFYLFVINFAFEKKNYDKVIAYSNELLKATEENYMVYVLRARAYFEKEEKDSALEDYEKAYKAGAFFFGAEDFRNLAILYKQKDRANEAVEVLTGKLTMLGSNFGIFNDMFEMLVSDQELNSVFFLLGEIEYRRAIESKGSDQDRRMIQEQLRLYEVRSAAGILEAYDAFVKKDYEKAWRLFSQFEKPLLEERLGEDTTKNFMYTYFKTASYMGMGGRYDADMISEYSALEAFLRD